MKKTHRHTDRPTHMDIHTQTETQTHRQRGYLGEEGSLGSAEIRRGGRRVAGIVNHGGHRRVGHGLVEREVAQRVGIRGQRTRERT